MSGENGGVERSVLQRRSEGFVLSRSQRLMQRVSFDDAESELAKSFTPVALQRGAELFARGGVSGMDRIGGRGDYHARVACEPAGVVYALVRIRPRAAGVSVEGTCTCEAVSGCEHLVAAAFTALAPSVARSAKTAPPARIDDLRLSLTDWLDSVDPHRAERARPRTRKFIGYVCTPGRANVHRLVRVATVPVDDHGRFGEPKFYDPFHLGTNSASYVGIGDQSIGFELSRLALAHAPQLESYAAAQGDVMRRIVESGRAFLGSLDGPRLHPGAPRQGAFRWMRGDDGMHELAIEVDGARGARLFATLAPWYVEVDGTCGPIVCKASLEGLLAALTLPRVRAGDVARVSEALCGLAPGHGVPLPGAYRVVTIVEKPVPCLRVRHEGDGRHVVGDVAFRYGERTLSVYAPDREWRLASTGAIEAHMRDVATEDAMLRRLEACGFAVPSRAAIDAAPLALPPFELRREAVEAFYAANVAALRAEGWIVDGEA